MSNFLSAAAGERPSTPPIWFMRQAGRSLPEYREIRRETTMMEACTTPSLVAEITAQPVRRHGVDAAIFFSDIITPLYLSGVGVDIAAGVGPLFEEAADNPRALDRLISHEINGFEVITEAARQAAEAAGVPLIGFAGAPFTLAAYAVAGRPSKDHLAARTLMHSDRESWHRLMSFMAEMSAAFLAAQVRGGARAIQLFDSWAGSLSRADYEQYVLPYSSQILNGTPQGVSIIHFGVGTGHFLDLMRDAGASVVGVDHRTPLDEASRLLGGNTPLQGNIDPALLAAPWEVLETHLRDVLTRGQCAPSHIVNLGHGVPPTTDPARLTRIVEWVHTQ